MRSASMVGLGAGLYLTAGHLIRQWPLNGGFLAPRLTAALNTSAGDPSALPDAAVACPDFLIGGEYDYRLQTTADWALLSATATPQTDALRAASRHCQPDLPGVEERLALCGHPGGQWSVDRQQVSLVDDPAPNNHFFWTTGRAVNGSSGSGLVNEAGQLVGILSGTNRDLNGKERIRFQRLGPVVVALEALI